MTLAELNMHLERVQKLEKAEETLRGLWAAAVPGAQKITGMPHTGSVSDKVGEYAVEIAFMEDQVERMRSEVQASNERIMPWIENIEDPTTNVIFRLRFIRGLSWKTVAAIVGGNTEESAKKMCYSYLNK